ncbi:potassium/sodium hyperpolarization-activated cyclic nucleotide-gated channel 1 [Triplophysa rosa]|uniref:Potassium/sodium hyperpolarization-activated cyclic nucleotide-gated channel 3-like n=1 Tax=Triplophysa rosa TaxID=992332 RepID=A0A9W7T3T0_TRIRA|nr:potassium/sodium hyperpolarization-activated cyclic nucleotide-gated channel 1 [Triplophysa rosa]KAI7790167.1 putative potassium/sodium hyperpolarization-activated cyclic nucleotide-gated channel 3-like [Triplophysa rosa]
MRVKSEETPEEKLKESRWIMQPLGRTRYVYLLFMVILTVVNLVTIPMDMAFAQDIHGTAHKFWISFNVISDIFFCLDILINFRMGFCNEDDQVPILDPQVIKNEYLRSWFVPDLLAAFPADVFIVIVENYHVEPSSLMASKLLRILMFARILSLIRLLRVPKLARFFLELESVSHIRLAAVRILFRSVCVILLLFLITHWNACIQFFICALGEFPPDSWVTREHLLNASIGEKYSSSFFRAFSQMTQTPYAFPDPPRIEEQWTTIISIVIGWWMLSALVALGIAAFAARQANIEELKNFEHLPKTLRQRVIAGYRWQQKKSFLSLLQESLKKDVMEVMCPNLTKGWMFASGDVKIIEAVLMKLEYEIFQAGDIIIRLKGPADMMFFIEDGRVLEETKFFQKELSRGDFFGEICLLLGGVQPVQVRALSSCTLFSLSVDKLQELEKSFPDVMTDLREVAHQHLTDIEKGAEKDGEEDEV